MAGISEPYGDDALTSVVGVMLSVSGYLLVPVAIGLAVTVGIETWVRDQRQPVDDLRADLMEQIKKSVEERESRIHPPEAE